MMMRMIVHMALQDAPREIQDVPRSSGDRPTSIWADVEDEPEVVRDFVTMVNLIGIDLWG